MQFVYRLVDDTAPAAPEAAPARKGDRLRALYGIFAKEFQALGGGEAFLKSEREAWGPDAWERYEMEKQAQAGTKA